MPTPQQTYRQFARKYHPVRRQVIELQSLIRQLEAELTIHHASQTMRLARYREEYYEATWIELEYVDDEE